VTGLGFKGAVAANNWTFKN